jgi:hypothetical protein
LRWESSAALRRRISAGHGVAEIEEHRVAERACDVPLEGAGDLGARLLVHAEDVVELLHVGRPRADARCAQAAAHRGDLPALALDEPL